jgi:hypothetical protein
MTETTGGRGSAVSRPTRRSRGIVPERGAGGWSFASTSGKEGAKRGCASPPDRLPGPRRGVRIWVTVVILPLGATLCQARTTYHRRPVPCEDDLRKSPMAAARIPHLLVGRVPLLESGLDIVAGGQRDPRGGRDDPD